MFEAFYFSQLLIYFYKHLINVSPEHFFSILCIFLDFFVYFCFKVYLQKECEFGLLFIVLQGYWVHYGHCSECFSEPFETNTMLLRALLL